MDESCLNGLDEGVEDVSSLLSAGLDDGEHSVDEAAAGGALRAEGEFAPDDGVAQGAFAGVVRRLDAVVLEELPEPRRA